MWFSYDVTTTPQSWDRDRSVNYGLVPRFGEVCWSGRIGWYGADSGDGLAGATGPRDLSWEGHRSRVSGMAISMWQDYDDHTRIGSMSPISMGSLLGGLCRLIWRGSPVVLRLEIVFSSRTSLVDR